VNRFKMREREAVRVSHGFPAVAFALSLTHAVQVELDVKRPTRGGPVSEWIVSIGLSFGFSEVQRAEMSHRLQLEVVYNRISKHLYRVEMDAFRPVCRIRDCTLAVTLGRVARGGWPHAGCFVQKTYVSRMFLTCATRHVTFPDDKEFPPQGTEAAF